jgi:hypothetical protein
VDPGQELELNMTTPLHLLRKTAAREHGSALVIAIVLMTFMLGSTLALVTYVDRESGQTGVNRTRETAFNFAEAALNSEVYALARKWPGSTKAADAGFKGTCSSSVSGPYCPLDSQLRGLFPTNDTAGATWKIDVRDNDEDSPDFYSDATVLDNADYDKDGNDQLWVRAEAVARGKKRVMVAQVRAESQPEDIVHAALLSGSLDLQNSGNKTTIDNDLGGVLSVRCTWNGPVQPCVGYEDITKKLDKLSQQITPFPGADAIDGYTGPPVLSAEAIERLKATADAYGTSYTACPSTLTGKVVYLDIPSGCKYTGNNVFNSPSQPGMLIVNRGKLEFGGTINFYGVIVHLNADNLSSTLIDLGGNGCVEGGVLVEGNGATHAGASGNACGGNGNIKYNPYMYGAVKSLANAGIIQNTWRELTPGT